jgi:hypothetical protein
MVVKNIPSVSSNIFFLQLVKVESGLTVSCILNFKSPGLGGSKTLPVENSLYRNKL